MSELYNDGNSRAGLLGWNVWRHMTTEDKSVGTDGAYMQVVATAAPAYSCLDFPQAGVQRFAMTTAAYTTADTTLTLASQFTNYHQANGDLFFPTSPSALATTYATGAAITSRTSVDAIVVDLGVANVGVVKGYISQTKRYIDVGAYGAIWVRAFGSTTNFTALARITGWMHPDAVGGVGKGCMLWDGTWTCGAQVGLPYSVTATFDQAAYCEVDTFTADAGEDIAGSVKYGVADGSNMLLVPTLGFPILLLEVINTVVEATETNYLGVLWRPEVVGMLA